MTARPRKRCRHPYCPNAATRRGLCAEHVAAEDNSRPRFDTVYNSARWKKTRARVLTDEPNCRRCGAPANVVDHVNELQSADDDPYDLENLQPLCAPCHNRKTATTPRRARLRRG